MSLVVLLKIQSDSGALRLLVAPAGKSRVALDTVIVSGVATTGHGWPARRHRRYDQGGGRELTGAARREQTGGDQGAGHGRYGRAQPMRSGSRILLCCAWRRGALAASGPRSDGNDPA